MKFDRKDVIIAVLTLALLFTIFVRGRRFSFADASPPASSGLGLTVQPSPAQLPSGSMLGKTVSEDCTKKYGAGWSRFTDTLCKKA